MGAQRCGYCRIDGECINWPLTERMVDGEMVREYLACPICGKDTTFRSDMEPLSVSEANHVRFDWMYRQREKRLAKARDEQAKQFADEMVELIGPLDPIGLDEAA